MKYRTLTVSEVARLFRVTERWINRLSKEQGFPKKAKGKYELEACVHWFIDHIRQETKGSKRSTESLLKAEERKAIAQADLLEINLAERRDELVPVHEIVASVEPLLTEIHQVLLGLPKKAAREYGNRDLEPFLDAFIRKLLVEISQLGSKIWGERSSAAPSGPEPEVDSPPAAAAKGKRVGRSVPKDKPRSKRRKRKVGHIESGIRTGDDGRDNRTGDRGDHGHEAGT